MIRLARWVKVLRGDIATSALGVNSPTPIRIPDDADNYMALDQSGTTLALGGGLGRAGIEIWDLDPLHRVDAACQVAGRNLTRAEWDANIGDLAEYAPTCPDLSFDGWFRRSTPVPSQLRCHF